MNAHLHIPPDEKPSFVQREALAKQISFRIQRRTDILLEQGEKVDILSRFMNSVSGIYEPFPIPDETEVIPLDAHIRAGEITLQARATGPTPIFYTGHLRDMFGGSSGTELMLDERNHLDPLETVALPGATFQIIGASLDHGNVVYQVITPDYPYSTEKGYFIDARFVETFWMPLTILTPREKQLPSEETILENLRNSLGLPYIWGGNIPTGVPKLLEYHPPKGFVHEDFRAKWTFRGVDCSGLLYAATDGFTPRNTSEIVNFGI